MGTKIYATVKNLAAYYHVSDTTVYRIVHEMMSLGVDGILRVGRGIRVDTERFEAFLKGNQNGIDTL